MATPKIQQVKEIGGHVAFLDILGFSELVNNQSFSDKFAQYSKILSTAVHAIGRNLHYITFSDSVLINTSERSEESLLHLIQAVSEISFNFLTELKLPTCGSISSGEFWRQKTENGDVMLAGPPIIDAYRLEQQQDWVGVMLSPRVVESIPNLIKYSHLTEPCGSKAKAKDLQSRFPWPLLIYRYQSIPFHQPNGLKNQNYEGFVIVPQNHTDAKPEVLISALEKYGGKLDELMTFAPGPNPQKKYRETQKCIAEIKNKWTRINQDWETMHFPKD